MNKAFIELNELLKSTFNEILKIEEQSINDDINGHLSITEMHTLEAIAQANTGNMSEISAKLRITVSTLTIAVTKLEKKGLARRIRSRDDRRIVVVTLTQEGEAIVKAHDEFHQRMVNAVFEQLNDAEIQVLIQAITSIKHFFREKYDQSRKQIG